MGNVPFAAIPPGFYKPDSYYAATGRWVDGDKVRFVDRSPEKIGGIVKLIEESFLGIARGSVAWVTYAGIQVICFGTAADLFLLRQGTITRITPFRIDATDRALTNPFTTTAGSPVVTVTDINHGILDTGVRVSFSGASAVGGITIDGEYDVTEIIDGSTFTITHASAATSSATGGGAVTASYEINAGLVDPEYLLGWGIGLWGETAGWGLDAPISAAQISEPRTWSVSEYGEDVICCPLNDTLYHYDTSAGLVRPTALAGAPERARYGFVTSERFIFALGCTTLAGVQDLMTVRWPDLDDPTDWVPSSTNRANERKLQGGSRLIAGTSLGNGASLVWSDSAIFLFQFTGSNAIYDSRMVGQNCGLSGPMAFAIADSMAFWMSLNRFHMFAGFPQEIPNADSVAKWVFDNIDREQMSKTVCWYNPLYKEVWWQFCGVGSTEPNLYAAVNIEDFSWITGTMAEAENLTRSSHARYGVTDGLPILFGTNGYIYAHDVQGVHNNDGAILDAWIELAPFDAVQGDVSLDVWGFIPDFERQTGDIEVTLTGRDRPRDEIMDTDVLTVSETDTLVDAKLSGRQIGMKIRSNVLTGDFRLGKVALEVTNAGRQR